MSGTVRYGFGGREDAPDTGRDVRWDEIDLANAKLGDARQIQGPAPALNLCRVQTRSGLARPWVFTWGLGRTFPNPPPALGGPAALGARPPNTGMPLGLLSWGTAGAMHMAEFDWGIGGQAQVLAAQAQLDVRLSSGGLDAGSEQVVSLVALDYSEATYHAQVVPGTLGKSLPVRRSYRLASSLGAITYTVPVPAFALAVRVSAVYAVGLARPILRQLTQDTTTSIAEVTIGTGANDWPPGQPWPIVMGASAFSAAFTVATAAPQIIFELAL